MGRKTVKLRRILPGAMMLLLAMTLLAAITTPARAAQSGLPCEVESAPGDGLRSAGFGLTRPELDSLYGAGAATQTGWYYEFTGFSLTLQNCDLIIDIDPNGEFADPEAARELVQRLLPEDAVWVGAWAFGAIQTFPQDADEWISAELAARYRFMGEPRTGAILVLYNYTGDFYQAGAIDHIEIRSAEIPQE